MPLTLQLSEPRKVTEPSGVGVIEVTRHFPSSKPVVINGCARAFGAPNDVALSGGYALTHGVDADFWSKWLAAHTEYPPVERGMIFAVAKAEDVTREAKNNSKSKSGFEPLDPDNVPAEFTAGKARIAAA